MLFLEALSHVRSRDVKLVAELMQVQSNVSIRLAHLVRELANAPIPNNTMEFISSASHRNNTQRRFLVKHG